MATNTQSQQSISTTLARALQGNGIFSAVSGLISLAAARPLAEVMGIPSSMALAVLGILLLGYAASLLTAVRKPAHALKIGPAAVGMDLLWVIGSIILLLSGWLPLTTAGTWIILIIGDIVLGFAGWQAYGLWQLRQQN
ncbi:MAG: hypothetical protein KDE51_11715 [Anaerolineales bacterium]|nr:hypothetical protein [Anaerolineales bacterium]